MQMADGSLASLVGSLDTHDVMSRLGEMVLRHRVTILGVLLNVAVRFHCDLGLPSPKSHVSLPKVVRKLRTLKVTGSLARMFVVGAKAG